MSAGADREIKAFVYPVSTPHEQLPLAAKLNSAHGWQLTEQDKESTAKALYRYGHTYEKMAETRTGGKAKVSEWLARMVKDNKERRNRKIFGLWLACHTQEEIAKAVDEPVGTIGRLIASDDFLHSVPENQTKKAVPPRFTYVDSGRVCPALV